MDAGRTTQPRTGGVNEGVGLRLRHRDSHEMGFLSSGPLLPILPELIRREAERHACSTFSSLAALGFWKIPCSEESFLRVLSLVPSTASSSTPGMHVVNEKWPEKASSIFTLTFVIACLAQEASDT